MRDRERIQTKASSIPTNAFNQAETGLFRKRPFAVQAETEIDTDAHPLPDLQTQLERGARFNESLSRMKVYGNRPVIQPKIAVGTPGDRYEQEADQVALQVMNTAPPIQRQDTGGQGTGNTNTPGRGISTEFGDYWIVPDETQQSYNVVGEQITESDFAKLENTWNALKSGSGNIKISETDSAGNAHNGFKDKIVTQFGKLLSKPQGRGLVIGLVNGSQSVTIRPSSSQIYGGANAIRGGTGTLENPDGKAGVGGTTIIQVDPDVKDEDIKVKNAEGKEISDPIFIFLGHELIHAQHNAQGRNRRNLPASDAAYSNKEEEETIATGSLTENSLRSEHGLEARYGHGGRDTR
jgi:hypothetical protein